MTITDIMLQKLHSEELHSSFSLYIYITVIKSRKIRWSGQVARMTLMRDARKTFVGNPYGNRSLRTYCIP